LFSDKSIKTKELFTLKFRKPGLSEQDKVVYMGAFSSTIYLCRQMYYCISKFRIFGLFFCTHNTRIQSESPWYF